MVLDEWTTLSDFRRNGVAERVKCYRARGTSRDRMTLELLRGYP